MRLSQTRYAGTVIDDASVGTVAWTNPANAQGAPDAVYATAALSGTAISSHYLNASNFGFNLPDAARIDGIQVAITYHESGSAVIDVHTYLVKAGTIQTGHDGVITVAEWPLADAVTLYGGVLDIWANAWTAKDINRPTFGVVFQCRRLAGTPTASVDSIAITVFYTVGLAEPPVVVNFRALKPPHPVIFTVVPSQVTYGFLLNGVGTADFRVQRGDPNIALLANYYQQRVGIFVSIERQDRLFPWVGYTTDYRAAKADPEYQFVATEAAGWLLQHAVTARSGSVSGSAGAVLLAGLREMETRGQPSLDMRLSGIAPTGPRVNWNYKADKAIDFVDRIAKGADYEWWTEPDVTPAGVTINFRFAHRRGRDRRKETTWTENKELNVGEYHQNAEGYFAAVLAVGGTGDFGSRPNASVNRNGLWGAQAVRTLAPSQAPGSPALAGTKVVISQNITEQQALFGAARNAHDIPEETAEQLSASIVESRTDMTRWNVGDVVTVLLQTADLGLPLSRAVRIIAAHFDPGTGTHQIECQVRQDLS